MDEVWASHIPAILWSIAVIIFIYRLCEHRASTAKARHLEILKLQKLTAAEVEWAEKQAAEEHFQRQSVVPAKKTTETVTPPSPNLETTEGLAENNYPNLNNLDINQMINQRLITTSDAVCHECGSPASKRCAACKSVNYCTKYCQITHWHKEHKNECHKIVEGVFPAIQWSIKDYIAAIGQWWNDHLPAIQWWKDYLPGILWTTALIIFIYRLYEYRVGLKSIKPKFHQKQRLRSQLVCGMCGSPASKRCSQCKSVHYCMRECQVKHWKEGHKNECHKMYKQMSLPSEFISSWNDHS